MPTEAASYNSHYSVFFFFAFIVLVSGGGSGIGKMIATGFAQNGAKVYIAARKENQLKEVRYTAYNSLFDSIGLHLFSLLGHLRHQQGCKWSQGRLHRRKCRGMYARCTLNCRTDSFI